MRQNIFNYNNGLSFFIILTLSFSSSAQSVWKDVSESTIAVSSERFTIPSSYKTYSLDIGALSNRLVDAPREFSVSVIDSPLTIDLPMPNGQMQSFTIVKSSLMHPVLQSKFPSI
jgi:hypothetical protein